MRRKRIKAFSFVLIAILVVSIGYAVIENINLNITGRGSASVNQNNFKVKFLNESPNLPIVNPTEGNTVTITSDTTAILDLTSLSKKDDTVTVTIKIKNESNGVGADFYLFVDNNNKQYFEVTNQVAKRQLQAGEMTTATITVRVKKEPIETVTARLSATLKAVPIDNENAISEEGKSDTTPYYIYYVGGSEEMLYNNLNVSKGVYYSPEAANTAFGHNAYIKIKIVDSKYSELHIAYVLNGQTYEMPAGPNESIDYNISLFNSIFGEENCDGDSEYYSCETDDLEGELYDDGSVYIKGKNPHWSCQFDGDPLIFLCYD